MIYPTLAASLLAPNIGLIFWITVVFLLLLVVLRRFAWGPIVGALGERERRIDESIRRAEHALAEARQIQADNQRARQEAEQEAQRILRESREAADRLRSEDLERTREQVRLLQQQAADEIEREKQAALGELRREVADLAIEAAGKILRENLDAPRQRRLVQDFLDRLPEGNA